MLSSQDPTIFVCSIYQRPSYYRPLLSMSLALCFVRRSLRSRSKPRVEGTHSKWPVFTSPLGLLLDLSKTTVCTELGPQIRAKLLSLQILNVDIRFSDFGTKEKDVERMSCSVVNFMSMNESNDSFKSSQQSIPRASLLLGTSGLLALSSVL